MRWAGRRHRDRLHHAGAVLAALKRDLLAEAEALAAQAVPPTPEEAPALTPSIDPAEATTTHQAATGA